MAAEILTLDPTSEDAANSPLILTTGSYGLTEHKYPQPAIDPQWASSASTEGSLLASQRYQNREVSVTVEVDCTASLSPLRTLQMKLAKLEREGGTLQRTMSDATVRIFDIVTADGYDPSFDQAWHLGSITTVSFTLTCKPLARGSEQTLTAHTETTLPALVFTETGIQGDVPATGRLVITDAQAQDQWWVTWGLESRYYQSAASAALFWQAESLTAQGGSATAAGTGASGAGSNVMRNANLATVYQSVLSTTSSGGTAMTHIGSFRVFARMMAASANSGTVSVGLEWTRSEFRSTARNPTVDLNSGWRGSWQIVDLGIVTLPVGTTAWEGRIIAKSTVAADDLDVDWLMLVPVDEGSGEAAALIGTHAPSSLSARDTFDSAGTLNTKTLPVGGTWATSGVATDFTQSTSIPSAGVTTETRSTSVSEATPRFAVAGTTSYTSLDASIDVFNNGALGGELRQGLVVRYVDASNYVTVALDGYRTLVVNKTIAGVVSTVIGYIYNFTYTGQVFHTIRARIDPSGRVFVWVSPSASTQPVVPVASASDAALATGGALASGKVGFIDQALNTAGWIRAYDNFTAYVPEFDAAVFASQSLEVRSDKVVRENSAGTSLQPVSSYAGDYLRVPPAGAEGRTSRFIVKASRNNPDLAPDTAIDDITAQLFYTPRFLSV